MPKEEMELDPQTEQQLADMSAEDWAALSARVRPPTSSEQLKSIAALHLSPDQLSTFMAIADPKKLANETGDIDQARVTEHLTRLYGTSEPQQQQGPQSSWGQHSGQPAGGRAGDEGRRALKARHNVGGDPNTPTPGSQAAPRGSSAKAELARRYPKGARK